MERISYVLYINLPYNFTDVNVHPSKTTISFRNESLITMLICEGIRKAVRESINLNENSKIRKEKKENPLDAQIAFETAEEYVVDEKEVENKLYSIKDNEQEKEDNNLKGEIKNTIDITEFYEQSKYPSFVDFEEKPLFEENIE